MGGGAHAEAQRRKRSGGWKPPSRSTLSNTPIPQKSQKTSPHEAMLARTTESEDVVAVVGDAIVAERRAHIPRFNEHSMPFPQSGRGREMI